MKLKPTKRDQVVVSCMRCGHKHRFESLDVLEKTLTSIPCQGCGFLFLQYLASKLDAALVLLKSDPKAAALVKDGRFDEFDRYLKEKTEL